MEENPHAPDREKTLHMPQEHAPDSLAPQGEAQEEEVAAGHRASRSLSLRFQLGRKLGEGGMGAVFEAYDKNLDRSVAVKVCRAELVKDPLHLDRFFHEAEILASMDHPGVLPIYETGMLPSGGGYFYAMKVVRGKTLLDLLTGFDVVDAKHPDRLQRFVRLFSEICDTMAYAHSRNIIHRDLKPENIMIDEYGVVLVLDWGLAKLINSAHNLTRPGGIVGTPGYMSPEQVDAGSAPLDARSDVFALGIILYQLLTGRLPFYAAHVLDVFEMIVGKDPKRPREVKREIPRELDAICMKALSKDPGDRYASAREFADEINRYLNGDEVGAYKRSAPERMRIWAGRHPAIASGLSVALVLMLMAGSVVAALGYMRNVTRERIVRGVDLTIHELESRAKGFDAAVPVLKEELAQYPESDADGRSKLAIKIDETEMLEFWFRDFMRVPLAIQVGFLGANQENPYATFDPETLERVVDSRIEQIDFMAKQGNLLYAHYQIYLALFGKNNMEKNPEQKNRLLELQRDIEREIQGKYGEGISMPDWSSYDLVESVLKQIGKK